jgi:preprotein translocase subunit SecA
MTWNERATRIASRRAARKASHHVAAVRAAGGELADLPRRELNARAAALRTQLAAGTTVDELLPQLLALAAEASTRTLSLTPYDEQILAAALLHGGAIAEMKTGEGKTLAAGLAAAANALAGVGVHVITANDYLAARDAVTLRPLYDLLGLTVAVLTPGEPDTDRRAAYTADITYGTQGQFGLDYLRDRCVLRLDQRLQRPLHYAIVDEADSVLIDGARSPYQLTGPSDLPDIDYGMYAGIAATLDRALHVDIDDKTQALTFTEDGITHLEQQLSVDNLYDIDHAHHLRFLTNAATAQLLFIRDRDYLATDTDIIPIDPLTGRPGRGRLGSGLHQALEAKEGLPVRPETEPYASMSPQDFFSCYPKLAGTTGTALGDADEFSRMYRLDVAAVPTHRPMIRTDRTDLVYATTRAKFAAVLDDIATRHAAGQPVLVGTTSVAKSEYLSRQLTERGITHDVLNAKNHAREADIIADAGRHGKVTIATSMAGRGVDILLGGDPSRRARTMLTEAGLDPDTLPDDAPERTGIEVIARAACADEREKVIAAGGLYVLGTERHDARRIDDQLRGRAGRQGDPGESRFYVALDDDMMRAFGNARLLAKALTTLQTSDEARPLESPAIARTIAAAQNEIEAAARKSRASMVAFDQVLATQRDLIYGTREQLLTADLDGLRDAWKQMLTRALAAHLNTADLDDDTQVLAGAAELYPSTLTSVHVEAARAATRRTEQRRDLLVDLFIDDAEQLLDQRFAALDLNEHAQAAFLRRALLLAIDRRWHRHLDEMRQLRDGISLRSYAKRSPIADYSREGFDAFVAMTDTAAADGAAAPFQLAPAQAPAPAMPAEATV